MWIYNSSNGNLSRNGEYIGKGYSGHGAGVDNPTLESIHNLGPIPRGSWIIGSFFDDLGGKGPIVCHLSPNDGTQTFGRGGLMIHGDTREANHMASHGCIILQRPIREAIASSGDTELEVV